MHRTIALPLRRLGSPALWTLLILTLGACATQDVEPPVAALSRAEATITDAEQAGARESAPIELRQAEQQLEQARQASRAQDYLQALRLAERATVDAELAEAKANHAAASTALAELEESLRALENEVGGQQNINRR